MTRKRVLVLCPTGWDHQNLDRPSVRERYEVIYYGSCKIEQLEAFDALAFLDEATHRFAGAGLDGVVGTYDYPSSILASILAARLGLPGPAPQALLLAQHKLHCRAVMAQACPEATPSYFAIDPQTVDPDALTFPLFVKPVKSTMSILACRVEDEAGLRAYLAAVRPHLNGYVQPFNALWRACGLEGRDASVLVAEEPLEGVQVTVEGMRWRGETTIMGIVDSIMFPGTLAFRRFDHPSSLPASVRARMADIAARVVAALGLDDLVFNVEMFYDADRDRVWIIEVNPRMSFQFGDLFEKVDGINTYDLQLAIATGEAPAFRWGAGLFGAATSYVMRCFHDAVITRLPTPAELEALRGDYPDAVVRVLGQVGERLSDQIQDMQSFRYGIVNLGGDDIAHAEARCVALVERLPLVLTPMEGGNSAD